MFLAILLTSLQCYLRPNLLSPKVALPTEEDYRPASPPAQRELGPPPPGYGRYAEYGGSGRGLEMPNGGSGSGGGMGRGAGSAGAGQFGDGAPRRNLDEVLCFKVIVFNILNYNGRGWMSDVLQFRLAWM